MSESNTPSSNSNSSQSRPHRPYQQRKPLPQTKIDLAKLRSGDRFVAEHVDGRREFVLEYVGVVVGSGAHLFDMYKIFGCEGLPVGEFTADAAKFERQMQHTFPHSRKIKGSGAHRKAVKP